MIAHSIEETKQAAREFASTLKGGEVVLLEGDLGAGKTSFAQGVSEALGADLAHSPTFSIMNVYPASHPTIKQIVHIDFYRINKTSEIAELGLEEWMGLSDVILLVEWPNAVEGLTWEGAKHIRFTHLSPTERQIDIGE